MCETNDEGALGLVLNRPAQALVSDYLPQWTPSAPPVVFAGGPVQEEVAVGLVRRREAEPVGFSDVSGRDGLFDLATPAELVDGAIELLRVFSGYAGWSSGQLEAELEAGDWLVVDAKAEDAFTDDPERLWGRVLRRQGGELGLLATLPEDPSLN